MLESLDRLVLTIAIIALLALMASYVPGAASALSERLNNALVTTSAPRL